MIRVLSLGAGVQSTTVLLMSVKGVLPKLDHAVFADTGWEPSEVYIHLMKLKEIAAAAGIPVNTVRQGNLRQDALIAQVKGEKTLGHRFGAMPLFVLHPNGERGQIRRQCTYEYKVRPIERFIRQQVLGLNKGQRAPKGTLVEHWFGISADEPQRMKDAYNAWAVNVYPLCNCPNDMLPRTYTRTRCIQWLEENYPDLPTPRSACIGCPYHSNHEWRQIKERPEQWADAVEFDQLIRRLAKMRGETFLHADRIPLKDVDLSTDVERGQTLLWGNECEGMCGV